MSKRKKRKKTPYPYEYQEWQDHQYDPGYYTGGKIPPYLLNPGKPKYLAWEFIFSSFVGLVFMVLVIRNQLRNLPHMEAMELFFFAVFVVILGFAIIVGILGGIKYLRMAKKSK